MTAPLVNINITLLIKNLYPYSFQFCGLLVFVKHIDLIFGCFRSVLAFALCLLNIIGKVIDLKFVTRQSWVNNIAFFIIYTPAHVHITEIPIKLHYTVWLKSTPICLAVYLLLLVKLAFRL